MLARALCILYEYLHKLTNMREYCTSTIYYTEGFTKDNSKKQQIGFLERTEEVRISLSCNRFKYDNIDLSDNVGQCCTVFCM